MCPDNRISLHAGSYVPSIDICIYLNVKMEFYVSHGKERVERDLGAEKVKRLRIRSAAKQCGNITKGSECYALCALTTPHPYFRAEFS